MSGHPVMVRDCALMSPVEHLWSAAGCPAPNWQGKATRVVAAPVPRVGVCALTGQHGPVWPLNKVTTTLTTLDRFPHRDADPVGFALGAPAAWAMRHRAAMQRPHAVVNGVHRPVTPGELFDALTRAVDDPQTLPSVPQSRQKHVIAWARWGRVGVDDEWLPWGATELGRLGTYRGLRRLGSGETALTEPEPRYPLLASLDRSDRRWVLLRWHDLDPWRDHPAYLDVAARATRKDM